ncbi:unnamed protein product [Linum trigynum]|uniref:Alpha/beta hydrolase fold-3 domain-containing protein n=1 Tax=Linum trigynum TaxID=586398 RepID=A0AAV2DGF1_9ROSI
MGSLPEVVEDCMGVLQLFSDGTVFRHQNIDFPTQPVDDQSVLHKDCLFSEPHDLRLRLYKPASAFNDDDRRLPVLFYFRGGGFCVGSRDWPSCHNGCQRLSSALDAVVVAPDYRLAPEDRLPAAMDDGVAAVTWLQSQAAGGGDEWFGNADFDRVFVVGDSSGGNIAHHVAVRLGAGSLGLGPVRVRGYVLLAPFFGGVSRTESEEGPREEMMSLEDLDRFWRLSLPAGEDRDHPLANPFGAASCCKKLEKVDMDPIMVIVGERELLRDRSHDYATKLAEMGKKVEYVEIKGKQHGFFTNDPYSETSHELVDVINRFILDNSS